MNAEPGRVFTRSTHLALVGVMALAAIGFLVGIGDGVPRQRDEDDSATIPTPSEGASPAVSYDELGARGPGAYKKNRYTVADLGVPDVDLSREIVVDTKAKPGSLAERAILRAYHGAPPTIPHATEQTSDLECVACHSTALTVGEEQAPLIPHAYYANCQQCHVADSPLFPENPLAANSFVGLSAPNEGDRAWEGAPPVIPHSTWMREQCLSCHGPFGKPGLQTSHPGRANCMQCHARSAELDSREPTVATLIYRPPIELRRGVSVAPAPNPTAKETP